jgi:hypothetical protein
MAGLHLYIDGEAADAVLRWLAKAAEIGSADIASFIHDQGDVASEQVGSRLGIRCVPISRLRGCFPPEDLVIVSGPDLDRRIGELFELGIHNVYNGNEIVSLSSAAERFLNVAKGLLVGPLPLVRHDPGAAEALRFPAEPVTAGKVPRHKLFIVNSMPKAGTIWMCAMLERVLGIRAREQIVLSHVADIETDWCKYNNHGAVALTRDLRDVVVSWFHNAARTDRELGFSVPRYRSVSEFYREFFIGAMNASRRYYRGDLVHWIDLVSANYVPIVRYEDMRSNPGAALAKVLNAWRVEYDPPDVERIVRECSLANMAGGLHGGDGYINTMLRSGHVRRGEAGGWKTELPADIATDISQRFASYQMRLGYGRDQS